MTKSRGFGGRVHARDDLAFRLLRAVTSDIGAAWQALPSGTEFSDASRGDRGCAAYACKCSWTQGFVNSPRLAAARLIEAGLLWNLNATINQPGSRLRQMT